MSTPLSQATIRAIHGPKTAVLAALFVALWLLHWLVAPALPALLLTGVIAVALLPGLAVLAWPGDVPPWLVLTGIAADACAITAAIHIARSHDTIGAPLLYAMLVGMVGLLFPVRTAVLAALGCVLAYGVMVGLEVAGPLPAHASLPVGQRDAVNVVLLGLCLVSIAWMMSYVVGRFTEGLRRSQERFALAVAGANDGIWDWELERDAFYVSPRWKAILGYADDELHPDAAQWLSLIHPDDFHLAVANTPRGGPTQPTNFEMEYRLRARDGYRWVHARGIVVHDRTGKPVRMVGSLTDIEQRKRAEEALRREQAEVVRRTAALQVAVRELERFGYSISHYLRGPLRAIDGFTSALVEEQGQRLDERGRADLDRVRAAARHMGELIDAFVALSQLGHGIPPTTTVDLSSAARAIAERLQAQTPERRVSWSIAPDASAHGDPTLLPVILDQLFENAWKFTRTRDRAEIEFGVAPAADGPVYFVRDNGIGFDMTYADKLFGAFEHLHGDAALEGLGMGLATVQRIVQRHGGRTWAEGRIGGGATFYFTLGDPETPATEMTPSRAIA